MKYYSNQSIAFAVLMPQALEIKRKAHEDSIARAATLTEADIRSMDLHEVDRLVSRITRGPRARYGYYRHIDAYLEDLRPWLKRA